LADKRYIVADFNEVAGVQCPCGISHRAITRRDTDIANVHLTHIRNAEEHYHKRTNEIYYIVGGSGWMVLDGDKVPVVPGVVVVIPTGCRHAGQGEFTALIVGTPPFEEGDEFFD